ncbi:MAG: hypothetical protein ABJ239_03090 [Erythrobacter sp.]
MSSLDDLTHSDLMTAGWDAMDRRDYDDAFPIFMALRASGDTDVFNVLGWMLENGEGCEKNLNDAVEMFRMSAEQGSQYGLIGLGDLLVDRGDFAEARLAFEQGVAKGHVLSIARLGKLLTNEGNTSEAKQRGLSLLNAAASKGQVMAKRTLLGLELAATKSTIGKATIWFQILWLSLSTFRAFSRDPHSERFQ